MRHCQSARFTTSPTGDKKIRAMAPVVAVSNRTASAQLQTAPTKHRGRKCLFIFRIHHNLRNMQDVQTLSSYASRFSSSRFHVSRIMFHSYGIASLKICVRFMIRRSVDGNPSRRCMVHRLSHITRSPTSQSCVQTKRSCDR